ncbi:MAG: hypothetical protein GF308_14820 [Candidatus Heimdallarchaeota archaeon]|nr:hypothetical protein [Candidatus Heimdallarchaeota archaeon]
MKSVKTINDNLLEIIKLKNVKIALVEWLPFDRNQLSALNHRLDSIHRRKGHIVTALMDNTPEDITFESEEITCKVSVKDYELSEFVSFQASINYPEEANVIQKEELSVNINSWGQVIYGADIIEVEDSKDGWVSLDLLTRIIADLTMDSSQMIDSLLTEYQRNLLDLVFLNESHNRTKVLLVFAEDITPKLAAGKNYFDGEELQNELEQLLGVLQKVEPINKGFLFTGTGGLIAVSPSVQDYEKSLLERGMSTAIRIFLDDYSARIWHLWDESRLIESDIDKAMLGDVTSLAKAQNWITKASSEAIMLSDILSYLRDSMHEFVAALTEQDPNRSRDDPIIQEIIQIQEDSRITTKRVNDTQKVIHGLETKMVALRDFSNALAEKHMRKISDSMAQNTKSMTQMTESNNRTSDALSIIELILAGSVILDIILLIVGEYGYPTWLSGLMNTGYGSFVILLVSIALWMAVFIFLRISKRRLESSAIRRQTATFMIARLCNIEQLESFLSSKNILMRNIESEAGSEYISVTWEPTCTRSSLYKIESVVLSYDAREEFLVQIYFETPDMNIKLKDCFNYLMEQMTEAGVFDTKDGEII